MASAGELHSVLLRSDGYAVALGQNVSGQCDIPDLDEGISYTQAGFMEVLSLLNENPRYKMVYNTTVYCTLNYIDDMFIYFTYIHILYMYVNCTHVIAGPLLVRKFDICFMFHPSVI